VGGREIIRRKMKTDIKLLIKISEEFPLEVDEKDFKKAMEILFDIDRKLETLKKYGPPNNTRTA
jgi:hypothetical protein